MLEEIIRIIQEQRKLGWGERRITQYLKDQGYKFMSRYKVSGIMTTIRDVGPEFYHNKTLEEVFPSIAQENQRMTEEKIKEDKKIRTLTEERNQLKKKYDHVIKENKLLAERQDLLDAVDDRFDPCKVTKSIPTLPKRDPSTDRAVAVMIASDWHVEERVDPKTINNLNEYSLKIAEERSKRFFENGVHLINQMSSFHQIDTLILGLLGDMITGYIHEELMESNECSPTEAMLKAQEFIIWGIEFIIKNTNLERVIIPCCFGNHGRTTQKRRISTGYSNSFEWAMYKNLESFYKGHEQIEFIVATGSHVYLTIFEDYVIRFHHGDDVRYGGGVGGLTIPLNKAIAGWDTVKKADLTIIGHFHQLTNAGNFIVNGCFTDDMLVTMENGTRKSIADVEIGEKVLTRIGESNPVVNKLERPHEGRLLNIRFQGKLNDIRCTPNHEFWAIKNNRTSQSLRGKGTKQYSRTSEFLKADWIPAEYLSKGDLIQIPWDKEVVDDPSLDLDFCKLLGFYLAEGSISKRYSAKEKIDKLNQINFTFHIDEVEYSNFVEKTLKDRFDCHVGLSVRDNKTTRAVVVSREYISNKFYELCGKGSHSKIMSNVLMKLPVEKQEQILMGWIQGDGHVNKGKSVKGRFRNVSGSTVSFDLASQMYILALRCGLKPRLYSQKANSQRKSDCFSIHFGKEDYQRIVEEMDEGKIKQEFRQSSQFRKTDLGMRTVNGDFFVPIESVLSERFKGMVYDLQIENEHSYVINGVGVHNSLIGYGPYALSIKASFEHPQQAFFLIHEKYGKTIFSPIAVR